MDIALELLRCPHGTEAIAIGNTRVTTGKHCGRWDVIKTYQIDGLGAIRAIEEAIEDEERNEGKGG